MQLIDLLLVKIELLSKMLLYCVVKSKQKDALIEIICVMMFRSAELACFQI